MQTSPSTNTVGSKLETMARNEGHDTGVFSVGYDYILASLVSTN